MSAHALVRLLPLCLSAVLMLACSISGAGSLIPRPTPAVLRVPTLEDPVDSGLFRGAHAFTRTGPDGKALKGSLNITGLGIGFQLAWTAGGNTETGPGILTGSTLAAARGRECMIVLYDRYEVKRSISSMWLDWNGGSGIEFGDPLGPRQSDPFEGQYTLEGGNPDGSAYGGTLTVSRRDKIYTLKWETGTSANYAGVGLEHKGRLAAASSVSGDCLVYAYDVSPDGSLTAVYAGPDGKTGSESTSGR